MLGQLTTAFIVTPYQEYRRTVGRIAHALKNLAIATDQPGFVFTGTGVEAARTYRDLASQLDERTYALPVIWLWQQVGLIPSYKSLDEASGALTLLSNSIDQTAIHMIKAKDDARRTVRQALDIRDPDPAPSQSASETIPGGRFIVDGKWVDANGIETAPPPPEGREVSFSPFRRRKSCS